MYEPWGSALPSRTNHFFRASLNFSDSSQQPKYSIYYTQKWNLFRSARWSARNTFLTIRLSRAKQFWLTVNYLQCTVNGFSSLIAWYLIRLDDKFFFGRYRDILQATTTQPHRLNWSVCAARTQCLVFSSLPPVMVPDKFQASANGSNNNCKRRHRKWYIEDVVEGKGKSLLSQRTELVLSFNDPFHIELYFDIFWITFLFVFG